MHSFFRGTYSRISTFFLYDLSRTALYEFLFATATAALLVSNYYGILGVNVSLQVVILIILWSFLALRGFFIPYVYESWTVSVSGPKVPGIPLLLEFWSKGGFIASRKIQYRLSVAMLQDDRDSHEEFREYYSKLSMVFFNSIQLPIEKGRFLGGQPTAGGIELLSDKLSEEITIMFSSPGNYEPILLFEKSGDTKPYGGPMPENLLKQKLIVSPPENWIALRNYAITYALSLIILLLTLVQLKLVSP